MYQVEMREGIGVAAEKETRGKGIGNRLTKKETRNKKAGEKSRRGLWR